MASASSDSSAFEASPPTSSTAASTSSESSSLTPTATTEKSPDETSKIRMFLGILRKFIGVADMASVRFSLPAQLLEPTPNLEYWNYLDQPNTFVAIGDADEPLDRMLEVLRFWFSKDLKYVKGKPCKPYNSALGEFFRCSYDVEEPAPPIDTDKLRTAPSSAASSVKSTPLVSRNTSTLTVPKLEDLEKTDKKVRVSYLTEQTSHHPPVSAFFVNCPEKGVTAQGFDQISAKFTGTGIKKRDNEQYHLTHPIAHVGGLLRGSLSVTVGDQCYITCPKTKIKTILHYMEEGWLGKTQNKVEGVIFRYDPENDNITRTRDVPEKDILGRISGNWREKMFFTLGNKGEKQLQLTDLVPLSVASKVLPPAEQQLPNESLRFWSGVTEAILARQFSQATAIKQELEERQREKAKERQNAGVEWKPRFFTGVVTPLGKPELTDDGKEVLQLLQEGKWEIKESDVLGA